MYVCLYILIKANGGARHVWDGCRLCRFGWMPPRAKNALLFKNKLDFVHREKQTQNSRSLIHSLANVTKSSLDLHYFRVSTMGTPFPTVHSFYKDFYITLLKGKDMDKMVIAHSSNKASYSSTSHTASPLFVFTPHPPFNSLPLNKDALVCTFLGCVSKIYLRFYSI